ncbi:UNVERIFIED_CONTAM: glucose inhibited division protein A subfamily protein [Hammondia hammondi]|eukprot:XP_008884446.1 glucose inhibited division protein A subfamily protein [Hammondia hammondi]
MDALQSPNSGVRTPDLCGGEATGAGGRRNTAWVLRLFAVALFSVSFLLLPPEKPCIFLGMSACPTRQAKPRVPRISFHIARESLPPPRSSSPPPKAASLCLPRWASVSAPPLRSPAQGEEPETEAPTSSLQGASKEEEKRKQQKASEVRKLWSVHTAHGDPRLRPPVNSDARRRSRVADRRGGGRRPRELWGDDRGSERRMREWVIPDRSRPFSFLSFPSSTYLRSSSPCRFSCYSSFLSSSFLSSSFLSSSFPASLPLSSRNSPPFSCFASTLFSPPLSPCIPHLSSASSAFTLSSSSPSSSSSSLHPFSSLSSPCSAPQFDVCVVGAGHAGLEAALASARVGASTLLVTQSVRTLGELSCNPSIGGIGKGTLVSEVDALGGGIGRWADQAAIHWRVLNASRGPATWGVRAQIDRELYKGVVTSEVQERVDRGDFALLEGRATRLLVEEEAADSREGERADVKAECPARVSLPVDVGAPHSRGGAEAEGQGDEEEEEESGSSTGRKRLLFSQRAGSGEVRRLRGAGTSRKLRRVVGVRVRCVNGSDGDGGLLEEVEIFARTIVVTAGTFLKGKCSTGTTFAVDAGRLASASPPSFRSPFPSSSMSAVSKKGSSVFERKERSIRGDTHPGSQAETGAILAEQSASELAASLRDLGLPMGRFKTGTPARLYRHSIDFSRLQEQPSESPSPFSFLHSPSRLRELRPVTVSCFLTYTNLETHEIVQRHLEELPRHSGGEGRRGLGPRYCPSIATKVLRFPDRPRHAVWLEPEGLNSALIYPNGLSGAFSPPTQLSLLRSIRGLENVEMASPAYDVEYDFVVPSSLSISLESKTVASLFVAGQVLGTTGYEEAAAMGLLAGWNAALRALRDRTSARWKARAAAVSRQEAGGSPATPTALVADPEGAEKEENTHDAGRCENAWLRRTEAVGGDDERDAAAANDAHAEKQREGREDEPASPLNRGEEGKETDASRRRVSASLPPAISLCREKFLLGVCAHDLTQTGVQEPYRMFASRSECRLSTRPDNADLRCIDTALRGGIVRDVERMEKTRRRREKVESLLHLLRSYHLPASQWRARARLAVTMGQAVFSPDSSRCASPSSPASVSPPSSFSSSSSSSSTPSCSLSSSTPSALPSASRSRFPSVAPWTLVEKCLLHLLAKLGASERSWKAAEIVAALPSSFFPASTDPLVHAHSPSSPSSSSAAAPPCTSVAAAPSFSAATQGGEKKQEVPEEKRERESSSARERRETEEKRNDGGREGEREERRTPDADSGASLSLPGVEELKTCVPLLRCPLQLVLLLCLLHETYRNPSGSSSSSSPPSSSPSSPPSPSSPSSPPSPSSPSSPSSSSSSSSPASSSSSPPSSSSSSSPPSSSPSSPSSSSSSSPPSSSSSSSSSVSASSHSSRGERVSAQKDTGERFSMEATDEEAREKNRRPWTPERQEKVDTSAQLKCTLRSLLLHWEELEDAVVTVAAECRYSAYFEGQEREAEIVRGKVDTRIPPTIQYTRSSFPSFSTEELEQLEAHRPQSLREAARVPGLHPASLLSLYRFVSLLKNKAK